ncbi:tetratricopeptide repeat protein [Candidatus Acetothermia bacterium]|nr:tetratricopeptide repeat protein [Candidatus Acetothermia bacterium]
MNLRHALYELKKILGDYLSIGREQIQFLPQNDSWLDLEEFEQVLQRREKLKDSQEQLRCLEEAVALYRGRFLEGCYDDWVLVEQRRWNDLYLSTLSQLAESYAQLKEYAKALEQCRRVLEIEPWRENAHRQKMLYHYLVGETSEALDTYQHCVKTLKEHLGTEPSPETHKVYEQMRKHEVSTMLQASPNNLPKVSTHFIGRELEISEIKKLLATAQLVTLVGIGGAGKTRLALQTATELLGQYSDGVWWIDLAALSDPALVPQAMASVLSVQEVRSQSLTSALSDYLRSKQNLLVVDNCEHVLDACTQLIEALLRSCPRLHILATSREALGIAEEQIWPVPSMSLPVLDENSVSSPEEFILGLKRYDAVFLFVDRASLAWRHFELTREDAPFVIDVCRKLDGIPLAIELAAARMKLLPVEQILSRLNDLLQLLKDSSGMVVPRHQTLERMLDWSFDLLSDAEKTLLCRLSVFMGGWTLEAAESICADSIPPVGARSPRPYAIEKSETLDLLTQLADKSLVVVEESSDQRRYRLLETVRQYAQQKLREAGEAVALSVQHREYFLALSEEADSKINTVEQPFWLNSLKTEHDNLRKAMGSALDHKASDTALRLVGALGRFWEMQGFFSEGRRRAEEALTGMECAAVSLQARALQVAGILCVRLSDFPAARSYYERSLAFYQGLGNQRSVANLLNNLAILTQSQGNFSEAQYFYEKSLALRRQVGSQFEIFTSLHNLAILAYDQGDIRTAHRICEEALSIVRAIDNKYWLSQSLSTLGDIVRLQGNYELSRALLEESLAILQALESSKWGFTSVWANLGHLAYDQGDYESARSYYEKFLQSMQENDNKKEIASALYALGNVATQRSEYETARTLYRQSMELSQEIEDKPTIATLYSLLGHLALKGQNWREAHSLFAQSLTLAREMRNLRGVIISALWGSAKLRFLEERWPEAAKLLGACESLRETMGIVVPLNECPMYENIIASIKAHLSESNFAKAWAEGRVMTLEEAMALAVDER